MWVSAVFSQEGLDFIEMRDKGCFVGGGGRQYRLRASFSWPDVQAFVAH